MNTEILASQTLQIIAAGVAGGALQSIGEDAYQKAKSLLDSLRARLSGDEASLSLLGAAQEASVVLDADQQAALLAIVTRALNEDDSLRAQAEVLVAAEPQLRVVQSIGHGQDVVGVEAEEFASGQVEVQQQVQKAEGVIGAKIGKIG